MSDLALVQHPLPSGSLGRRSLGWWGVLCLIASEAALFVYLLFTYYYYAVQLDKGWMPAPPPSMRLALPNTIILFLSSIAVWYGERGVRRGARSQHLAGLTLAVILGIVFVAIQMLEWHGKTFSLRSSLYGSLYFTITGSHMAHVIVGLVVLLVVLFASVLGFFDTKRNSPVLIASAYWHFVDAVWIAVFITFYVTPHLW